jgi:lipoyl(octanoyl) transferase
VTTIRRIGYGEDAVEYLRAWDLQRELHARRVADEIEDTVLFLEHPFVFTAGKRTEPQDRPAEGTPVVEVDRGGKITWHGPGQLVAYPITKLPAHVYVVDFVRRLEETMIGVCRDLGLATGRVPGRSGVWLAADTMRPERKVGALGIRVSQGVTMHGLELNCDNSLDGFDAIIPCGIADAGVTTLSRELGRDVTVAEVDPLLERHLLDALTWAEYTKSPDIPRPAKEPAESSAVQYGLHPIG